MVLSIKKGLIFALIPILIFVLIFNNNIQSLTITTLSGEHTFNVEIADNTAEITKGLMFRKAMSQNEGMFFVFDSEEIRSFWMKNTYIPLDIIFINSQMEVIDIKVNAQPCKEEVCKRYTSNGPAQYVLEINSGLSEEIGLEIGNVVGLQ